MKGFIELTDENGNKVLISTDSISHVSQPRSCSRAWTYITLKGDGKREESMEVQESYEIVVRRIREAGEGE